MKRSVLLMALLAPILAAAAEPPPASVAECAARAVQDPELFSRALESCVGKLPRKALLEGATWNHPRPAVVERARRVLVRAIRRVLTPLTADEATLQMALVQAPDWHSFRNDLLENLAQWPEGRARIARFLETAPAGPERLSALLQYLHGSGIEPCRRADLKSGAGTPSDPLAPPPTELARLTAYADEARRAYLTARPFEGVVLQRDLDSENLYLFMRGRCDEWLIEAVRDGIVLNETGQPARALLRDRLFAGDPVDAAALLVAWSYREPPGPWVRDSALHTTGALRETYEDIRGWIEQTKLDDLASVENQTRLCVFNALLGGTAHEKLPRERCPDTRPRLRGGCGNVFDPDATPRWGSYADLEAFGLPGRPGAPSIAIAPRTAADEEQTRAKFVRTFPLLKAEARALKWKEESQ